MVESAQRHSARERLAASLPSQTSTGERPLSEDCIKRYSLTLSGNLIPRADRATAIATLTGLFRLSESQAESLLSGRPRKLKGFVSLDQVHQAQEQLKGVGIACQAQDETIEPAAPPSAAAVFASPSALDVESDTLRCPKCDEAQPPGEICRRCGIAFAKFRPLEEQAQTPRRPVVARIKEETFPYKLVNQLVLLVFLSGLGLAIWSHWKKDQFPPPGFYDTAQLVEPLQTPTDSPPFQIEAQGIRYTIEPLFDYRLEGVVVSLHDADALGGIYHFKEWKDFINIRDLCVVWGDNVATGAFRDMQYRNSTWTCWITTNDALAAQRFAWDQLSNNHLLSHDPAIQAAIKSAEIGDHIRVTGQLARYSHAGGFSRGSSITRTDTGNGACETIHVDRFEIVRKSNTGWRLTYRISVAVTLAALLGLTVLLFVAPYDPIRRSR